MMYLQDRFLFLKSSHLFIMMFLITLLAGCASHSHREDQNNLDYESRALR